ncbi:hypothetical protein [Paludisphaera sp.]|uniref:hypothetical protein n=1 Tax=Paludisphaera sp. TaxID=2017432 RepID=UPI00301BC90A
MLNVLVLDGLSILATALILRRWGGTIEAHADPETLKKLFLAALFVCFIVARVALRTPSIRAKEADPETRGRAYVRSRVATAAFGWLALPLGLGYGLTVDPSLTGLAPFWVAALLLGVTALPRESDVAEFDGIATGTDA